MATNSKPTANGKAKPRDRVKLVGKEVKVRLNGKMVPFKEYQWKVQAFRDHLHGWIGSVRSALRELASSTYVLRDAAHDEERAPAEFLSDLRAREPAQRRAERKACEYQHHG